jgi:urea transport system permease protein
VHGVNFLPILSYGDGVPVLKLFCRNGFLQKTCWRGLTSALIVTCLLFTTPIIYAETSQVETDKTDTNKNPPEDLNNLIQTLSSDDSAERKKTFERMGQSGDARLIPLLTDYSQGSLYRIDGQLALGPETKDSPTGKIVPLLDPLTRVPLNKDGRPWEMAAADIADRALAPNRAERRLVNDALTLLRLFVPNKEQRIMAIQKAGDTGGELNLIGLKKLQETEQDARVRHLISENIALIELASPEQDTRINAVKLLGELASARGLAKIREALKNLDDKKESDVLMLTACREAIGNIERWQTVARSMGHVFSGISLGSVLILMALGLSIIFGLMGVINMAHGEMLMIGAYATLLTQKGFSAAISLGLLPVWSFEIYFLVAIPMSMLCAGVVGMFIEWSVIRHLYGRPLETLLATFGVSFILIQSIRLLFGNNQAVNNPSWLQGGWEIATDVIFPYNRLFIIVFCAIIVAAMYLLIAKTRLGLMLRATTQNRTMASTLGINTRRIDNLTFALGSGIAGMAGCALTLISNITPDMGQAVIVDSFMVVVAGGVGKLAGAIIAGFGLGCFSKSLEPWFGAVWGQVLMLAAVVVFLQWKPSGLFPAKGRLADA